MTEIRKRKWNFIDFHQRVCQVLWDSGLKYSLKCSKIHDRGQSTPSLELLSLIVYYILGIRVFLLHAKLDLAGVQVRLSNKMATVEAS